MPQVESWRWQLTYQLAQLNDPASAGQVGENYAGFIVQALNSGAVDLSRLYCGSGGTSRAWRCI